MLNIPLILLIIVASTISMLEAAPAYLTEKPSDVLDVSTPVTKEHFDTTVMPLLVQGLNMNVMNANSVPLYSRVNSWHVSGSNDEIPAKESIPDMPQQGQNPIMDDRDLNQPFVSITTEELTDNATVQPPQEFTSHLISVDSIINYSTEKTMLTTEYGIYESDNTVIIPSTNQPVLASTRVVEDDNAMTSTADPPVIFKSFDDSLKETLDLRNKQAVNKSNKAEETEAEEKVTIPIAEDATETADEIVHRDVENAIIEETQLKVNNEVGTETPKVENGVELRETPVALPDDDKKKFISAENEAALNEVVLNVTVKEETIEEEKTEVKGLKIERTTAAAKELVTTLDDEVKEAQNIKQKEGTKFKEELKEFQAEKTTTKAEDITTTEDNEGKYEAVDKEKYRKGNFEEGFNVKNDLKVLLQEHKIEETTTKVDETTTATEGNEQTTDATEKDKKNEVFLLQLSKTKDTEAVIKKNGEPLSEPVQIIIEAKNKAAVDSPRDFVTTTDGTTTTLKMVAEYDTKTPLHFGIDDETESEVSQTTSMVFIQNTSNKPIKVTESSAWLTTIPAATSIEELTRKEKKVEMNIKPIHTTRTEQTTTTTTNGQTTTTTEQTATPVQTTTPKQITTPVQTTITEAAISTTEPFLSSVEKHRQANPFTTTESPELKSTEPTRTTTSTTAMVSTTANQEPPTTFGYVQEANNSHSVKDDLIYTRTNAEVIYTTTTPTEATNMELQQWVKYLIVVVNETEAINTNLETSTMMTTTATITTTATETAIVDTVKTTVNPTTNILTEVSTAKLVSVAPEARALNTPAPIHIERIFNEDGVEVLYGYSSVVRTNQN